MIPRNDIHYLDISTEDAFTMIMSAGLVVGKPLDFLTRNQSEQRKGAESIVPND